MRVSAYAKGRLALARRVGAMRLAVWVEPGMLIPRGFGFAWCHWSTQRALCLPIPFNVAARAIRAAYLFFKHPARQLPVTPREAFAQGYAEGYVSGQADTWWRQYTPD
jgi:hypothetical protein